MTSRFKSKLILLLAILVGTAAPAAAKTVCNAIDNTARVLSSANPNDLHPDWTGQNRVGTGQEFVLRKREKTDVGVFFQGDLYTTRGSPNWPSVWIIAKEWDCVRS